MVGSNSRERWREEEGKEGRWMVWYELSKGEGGRGRGGQWERGREGEGGREGKVRKEFGERDGMTSTLECDPNSRPHLSTVGAGGC